MAPETTEISFSRTSLSRAISRSSLSPYPASSIASSSIKFTNATWHFAADKWVTIFYILISIQSLSLFAKLLISNTCPYNYRANINQGAPVYASVATLQRDRTQGMTLIRTDKDGPIFYENPYAAMPPNKNLNRYFITM